MKKIVCIGGGTGQSALLKGLKNIRDIELSTIVAVSDDGGSTGRLRNELNIPAMGDVRNVMVALAKNEDLMTKMMNYRFDENSGSLSSHSLGNIIISALTKDSRDFLTAIHNLSETLKVRGKVYPCTTQSVTLSAHMCDGSIIDGETQIRESKRKVKDVFYKEEVHTYREVVQTIEDADFVIIGIGSLYTSILPNLIIDDIKKALIHCRGKVIYCCNCMTEAGETDNYSLEDHVQAIEKHVGEDVVDIVVFSKDVIPQICMEKYSMESAEPVIIREKEHDYEIVLCDLLRFDNDVVRHDSDKLQRLFEKIIG